MPWAIQEPKASAGGIPDASARLRGASHALLVLAVYFLDDTFLGVVAIESSSMPSWVSALLVLGTCLGAVALYLRARQMAIAARAVAGGKQPAQAAAVPKLQVFRALPRGDGERASLIAKLAAAGKEGDFRAAEATLKEMGLAGCSVDACCYNHVIQACTGRREPWLAKQWLRRMEDASVEPNAHTYSILMDYTAKAGNAERTEECFRRMCKRGVIPNKSCYAAVIHARAQTDELEVAEAWISAMLKAGLTPNLACVSSLVHAYSRRGDVQSAEGWFHRSTEWGITPGAATLTSLIHASAKCGDPARAESWLERMLEDGVKPTVASYTAVIDAYAKAEDAAGAGRWYRRMLGLGVQPNAVTYGALVNAYAKVGDVDASEGIVEEMLQRGISASLPALCGVIDACVRQGDVERGVRTFQRLRQCGLKPNVVAYASLARLFSKDGDWVQCEALAEEMRREGVAMNEHFLYTLLLSYGKARPRQGERAEGAFRDAVAGGLKANAHVQDALRRVLGSQRCEGVISEVTGEDMAAAPPVPRTRRARALHVPRDSAQCDPKAGGC